MGSTANRRDVVLVRHGETAWTKSGQHTGRTDIELTERGRAQARALAKALVGRRLAPVFTSPMARAVETSKLAGFGDITICDDLREWDYGVYEGRTTAEIRREVPDWSVWTHHCPGGETVHDIGARADRVIALARDATGDVALFGHGHQLRVLAARWCGLTAAEGRILALAPSSISVLSFERETPVIGLWNQVARDGRY